MPEANGAIRVLHVDDDADFRDVAATFLERADEAIQVEPVESAADGLERLGTSEVDCIVSDYDMPGRNGIAFLEHVREVNPDLPFILFTGKGSEEIASDAISAGVTDYLQKGHGTDQYDVLANRIRNAVEGWRAEQSAERTRARLEAITGNSADAIVTIDAESRIRFANEAVADLFGFEPETVIGDSLTRLMPDRYRDAHIDGIENYLATGERHLDWEAVEFPVLHRDGHEIPVSVSFSEYERDGDPRFIGIIRDVSERVRIEEELRERERRFRQMAESIEEVVWMSNPEKDEMFYVSPAYEEIWGRPVETVYDEPTAFLDAIHPADRDDVSAALSKQSDGCYDEEYRVVQPDGEIRWVRDRATPVRNDAGEIYRIVGIATDITERVEREREYERILDLFRNTEQLADVGGWAINPRTEEVFWSENLFNLLGLEPGEEPPLEEALDFYVEEDRSKVAAAVETAIDDGEAFDVEARFRRDDGELRCFRIHGEPTVVDGEVKTLRGAVQDITPHKRREGRLEEFASMVSHDLRSPLSVATGGLELAREECTTEHLDTIETALDRMEALIDDILALAAGDGHADDIEPVDLGAIIRNCWQTVATGPATLESDIDVTIQADRNGLKRLLENLLVNAIEHGGDAVTVRVETVPDGFAIEDDGQGIPADDREQIFEAGVSTSEEGTGFGLRIAREIATAHGWSIRAVESAAGGARFEVTGVTTDAA